MVGRQTLLLTTALPVKVTLNSLLAPRLHLTETLFTVPFTSGVWPTTGS